MEKDYKKTYEDALERARIEYKNEQSKGNIWVCENLSKIFPELIESEDEKWRNWLIGHLKGYINQTDNKYAEVCKKAISWLEKQGKKLPVDWNEKIKGLDGLKTYILSLDPNRSLDAVKVDAENIRFLVNENKPSTNKIYIQKFKIGDTVCRQGWADHTIEKIYNDGSFEPVYICKNEEGLESHISFSEQDEWKLKDENKYDKGYNDGFSASENNRKMTEEDIRRIDNIIGCLEEFTKPGFPIFKGGVFHDIKWLEDLKSNGKYAKDDGIIWTPSKKQMYILNWVANILLSHDGLVEKEASKELNSLYGGLCNKYQIEINE